MSPTDKERYDLIRKAQIKHNTDLYYLSKRVTIGMGDVNEPKPINLDFAALSGVIFIGVVFIGVVWFFCGKLGLL